MKCINCGFENEEKSKFCVNCGNDISFNSDLDILKCLNCGYENRISDNFCTCCGINLKHHEALDLDHGIRNNKKHSHGKHNVQFDCKSGKSKSHLHSGKKNKRNIHSLKRNAPSLKSLWITLGVIIVSLLIASSFDLTFHKYPNQNSFQGEIISSNPVIEAQVVSIASKFVCSCLTKECAETSLDVCKCDIAQGERQFIRNNLEHNKKPDDIVVALANKYGLLKSQFASKYKVDRGEVLCSK